MSTQTRCGCNWRTWALCPVGLRLTVALNDAARSLMPDGEFLRVYREWEAHRLLPAVEETDPAYVGQSSPHARPGKRGRLRPVDTE